jgi:hypothetical protein
MNLAFAYFKDLEANVTNVIIFREAIFSALLRLLVLCAFKD